MMRRWLVHIGLWLARLGGWEPPAPVPFGHSETLGLDPALIASTHLMTEQTGKMGGSGEYRRREALRALMNRHPEAKERDIAFAIEAVIRGIL